MEVNTYRVLKPVEIVEYLCQGSANGFSEGSIAELEKKLGLPLPVVLRDFLLRAGRERICTGEQEIFPLKSFRRGEGYLAFGEMNSRKLKGIMPEDITKDNPPVYVRDAQGKWDIFAESMEDYLLAELDRRIRKTKISDHSNQHIEHLERYFYCRYLLCKEWTLCMDSSEIFVPGEKWGDIFPEKEETVPSYEGEEEELDEGEDWDDEEDWVGEEEWDDDEDWNDGAEPDSCPGHWVCPRELKSILIENKVSLPPRPYSIAICLDEETGILYSACFPRDEQRFASLLQINEPRAVRLQGSFSAPEVYYAERLLDQLAEEVHAPVMGPLPYERAGTAGKRAWVSG